MVNGNPSIAAALRSAALAAWRESDPRAKAAAALALAQRARLAWPRPDACGAVPAADTSDASGAPSGAGRPESGSPARGDAGDDERPGRPARPRMVAPRALAARPAGSAEGRAALLHSVAHIELNAIDLALDAAWRFDSMPDAFLSDWLSVAGEEARHFELIADELGARGWAYGDFDAHDGLWRMAELTRGDALARMALVPGVMEARGLDATPPMQARLASVGDARAVALLQVILDEEVGHVAIGRRWFRWLCARRGLEPREAFAALARLHGAPPPRGPLNVAARRAAGWEDDEIAAWAAWR